MLILALPILVIPCYAGGQTNHAKYAHASKNPPQRIGDSSAQYPDGKALKNEDQQHVNADVKVISLPSKDWQDIATFWITAALAFVGFGGLFFAKQTLRTIQDQTAAAKDAANGALVGAQAALEQINLMKNKERARIVLSPQPLKCIDPDNFWGNNFVETKVENIGYSNAFNLRFEYRCEITSAESLPASEDRSTEQLQILRAEDTPRSVSLDVTASEEMWEQSIVAGAKDLFVHLWGTIFYENSIGSAPPLKFHFIFHIHSLEAMNEEAGTNVLPVSTLSRMWGWKKCPNPQHNC